MRIEQPRMRAAAGVAALHALIGYVLLRGLASGFGPDTPESLSTFDVVLPPLPPEVEEPQREAQADKEEGEAAPPNLVSDPAPVAAPEPKVVLKPDTPLPPQAGQGKDASAGAADVPGPGTGAGGVGSGTGAGGEGSGPGGGGRGRGAQRVRGGLSDSDYPDAAARVRAEGTVHIRYTVSPDGRARNCTVTRSSGHEVLDRTTCRLVERRFRYRPATDAQGRAVEDVVTTSFSWGPRS